MRSNAKREDGSEALARCDAEIAAIWEVLLHAEIDDKEWCGALMGLGDWHRERDLIMRVNKTEEQIEIERLQKQLFELRKRQVAKQKEESNAAFDRALSKHKLAEKIADEWLPVLRAVIVDTDTCSMLDDAAERLLDIVARMESDMQSFLDGCERRFDAQ